MIISACHAEAIHEIVSMQIEATSSELKHSKDRAIEMFMSTEVGESGFFELKPRHSFDGLLVKFVQKMLEYPRDLVGWSLQLFEEKLAAKMEKQHSIQPDPVWAKFTDAEPLRRTRVVVEDTTPPAGGRPGGSDATSDGLPPYEEATHD